MFEHTPRPVYLAETFYGLPVKLSRYVAADTLHYYHLSGEPPCYLVRDLPTLRRFIAETGSARALQRHTRAYWDALLPKLAAADEAARLAWFWCRPTLDDDDAAAEADLAAWLLA